MLRELKFWILAVLLAMTASTAFPFAMEGPLTAEVWQTDVIGYRAQPPSDYASDIATPRALGEEYRWNTPILYYAFDANFLDFFGSNGVVAVDQAMAVLNGLTNVSSYSVQLTEVPMDSSRVNVRAAALGLQDMKSWTLSIMLEELGLANAERWTWALHDRVAVPGAPPCPLGMEYLVVHRNFDPVTFEPSSYVNGALLSYQIVERCTAPPPNLVDAYEFPVDPLTPSTAVASYGMFGTGLVQGSFYTGLTRDDVGGLRYLMRTNNLNVETADSTAVLISTSGTIGSIFVTITTSNLAELVQIAATNTLAQFQALFPDIVITSVSQGPQGFIYGFANVVTNAFFTNGAVSTTTISVFRPPFSTPTDPLQLRTNTQNSVQNFINGDYFVIPTNICSFEVVAVLSTNAIPTTTITFTNGTGTNVNGQVILQTITTYVTNHTLLVRETPCPTNDAGGAVAPALRQGIEKIIFVRRDFDSLLGQFWAPVTTNYTINAVSGGQAAPETFRRTVNQPDFLITASDQTGDPNTPLYQHTRFVRSDPQFVPGPSTLAGPGIIQAPGFIDFNKEGAPLLGNSSPSFLGESSASQAYLYWASYDGTTNAPVVYPTGTSIQNLENQVLIQITPPSLPDGAVGVFYSAQLGVMGGQPPFTFSLSPGSAGLPDGLTLSASGLISGTPTADDAFDFVVRLLDFGGRQVDKTFSITISP